MTTKALDFEIPPHIGAVIGGTTPNPGGIALGVVAYSTSLGRLVRWDGDSWEELIALANGTTAGLISATDFTKLGTLGVGITSSAGAADSGKVPKLDANGKLDPSFIPSTLTLSGLTVNGHIVLTGVADGVDISDVAAMSFITLGATGAVPNERVLAIGPGLKLTDGGGGGNVTLERKVSIAGIGGSFTLATNHAQYLFVFNGPAGQVATVPANATTAIATEFACEFFNRSAVDYTIAAEAGGVVTFVGSSSPLVLRPGQGCRVTKVATDLWTAQRIDVTFSSSVQTIGATSNEGNDYTVAHGNHRHNHGALGHFDITANDRMHTLAVPDAADGFMSGDYAGVVASLGRGVTTSAGAGDVGKVPKLGADGKLDASVLPAIGGGTTQKYSALFGDGISLEYVLTHGIGSEDLVASVKNAATKQEVRCEVFYTNDTQVTIKLAVAPASNSLKCTVIG